MLQPGTCSAMRSSSITWAGTAGRARHALRHPGIVGRHDVRAAGAGDIGGEHRLHEIGQPVGIDPDVRVGVGDDLAGRVREADVARRAQPAVRHVDDAHARRCRRAIDAVASRDPSLTTMTSTLG